MNTSAPQEVYALVCGKKIIQRANSACQVCSFDYRTLCGTEVQGTGRCAQIYGQRCHLVADVGTTSANVWRDIGVTLLPSLSNIILTCHYIVFNDTHILFGRNICLQILVAVYEPK